MSRIEQALEKAARTRGTLKEGMSALPESVQHGDGEKNTNVQLPPLQSAEFGVDVTTDNPLLATLFDPHSPVSEEFRKLKSAIVAGAGPGGFNNTIMVASALEGEGKSMASLNLAITLSQEYDHTVLLIDADLRKPSLSTYLGIRPEKGLSDFLRKRRELPEILFKTGIGRLTLLPAGEPVKNPVELLSSQRMKDLMSEIKSRYPDRFVIVDAPPVLPFAETRVLSAMVDGVVLVVKEGKSSPKMIEEVLETITRKKVMGVVYNEATIGNFNGRYDYYRQYRYGYGTPASERKEGGLLDKLSIRNRN